MLHARTQVHQTYVFVLIQFQHHSILTQKHKEKNISILIFSSPKTAEKEEETRKTLITVECV